MFIEPLRFPSIALQRSAIVLATNLRSLIPLRCSDEKPSKSLSSINITSLRDEDELPEFLIVVDARCPCFLLLLLPPARLPPARVGVLATVYAHYLLFGSARSP